MAKFLKQYTARVEVIGSGRPFKLPGMELSIEELGAFKRQFKVIIFIKIYKLNSWLGASYLSLTSIFSDFSDRDSSVSWTRSFTSNFLGVLGA